VETLAQLRLIEHVGDLRKSAHQVVMVTLTENIDRDGYDLNFTCMML